jgi:transcriptional regulator with XRE-family HTH domain
MTDNLDHSTQEPGKQAEQRAVGQRLRLARETLGLKQEDVAAALGIQRTSVISMEAGKRSVTALELRRLGRLYRRTVAWILGEEPHATDQDTEATQALYRATAQLLDDDKEQVLRFAQFLASAGPNPVQRRQSRSAAPPQFGASTTTADPKPPDRAGT